MNGWKMTWSGFWGFMRIIVTTVVFCLFVFWHADRFCSSSLCIVWECREYLHKHLPYCQQGTERAHSIAQKRKKKIYELLLCFKFRRVGIIRPQETQCFLSVQRVLGLFDNYILYLYCTVTVYCPAFVTSVISLLF